MPGGAWPGSPAPAPRDARRGGPPLVTAAVVGGVVALGIVLAVVLGAWVVRSGAEDLGRGIGAGMIDASAAAMDDALADLRDDYGMADRGLGIFGPDDSGLDAAEVEQTAPEAPDGLGEDPVLDALAQRCFDGEFHTCDDLYQEAPLDPGYGPYGLTCGGRVAEYDVWTCSQLD
ncbi:hypothetical protein JD78_00127 [Modestobacter roseus]|uniref:Uncharacterized protein n=1 Tax=Modestobacter roseus TaxID=1181884 RepID=A0A562IKU6_9ACTN|nr:hypothetical protein JD78_00127 [Modestobacter roseus]